MTETVFDAVIVGARVAGSIAATLLAQRGHRILVLDRSTFPSPTLSTHFFRGGWCLAVLDRIGLIDQILAGGSPPLRREFHFEPGSRVAVETAPQEAGAIGFSLSVRRELLDAIILERAKAAGAQVRAPARVAGVLRDGDRVCGVRLTDGTEINAGIVVSADGRRSTIAAAIQPEITHAVPPLRALYYRCVHGWRAPDGSPLLDAAEFSSIDGEIAYVFPSDSNLTCIAVSIPAERFDWFRASPSEHFDERFAAHVAFADRMFGSERATKVFGTAPEPNQVRAPWGPGWALIGDAGIHQDPVAGLGMDSASMQALHLADALDGWFSGVLSELEAMERFEADRDAIGIPLFKASCGIS